MFFKSDGHKERFLAVIQQFGKVDRGKIDSEYGAALYIMTAEQGIWERVKPYLERNSIPVDTILSEVDFSHGYNVLMRLAGNLFNETLAHVDPVDFTLLDEANFHLALAAIQLRYHPPRIADLIITPDTEPPAADWKAIEAQAQADLEKIETDQDAIAFIQKYFSKDLQPRYMQIYRSDRHEMNRTPRQAIDNILSLPPIE